MTSTPNQPKIVQSRILRTAIVLFLAAGAIGGYLWYSRTSTNDSAQVNTKGYILALRNDQHDSHAVLIKPDGSIEDAPIGKEGADDREAVWRPDGSRIFISRAVTGSPDPELGNYHIYRWKPDESKVDRRTIGTRALAHPRFAANDSTLEDAKALATAGGRVLLFDPMQDSSIKQILPPATKEAVMSANDAGDETPSDFDAFYKGIGTSFREARWSADKGYIIAVMRRENGESLIVQKAEPTTDAERLPRLVVCGDHIDFDIMPAENSIVFAVQGFQWQDADHIPADFKKGEKVTRPYNHILGFLNLDKAFSKQADATAVLDISKNDAKCFGQPAVSPDGAGLAVAVGSYKGVGEFIPEGLMAYPMHGGSPAMIAQGQLSDPSWDPTGEGIAFTRRNADGRHDICIVPRSGTGERSLTAGKGDFSHPIYSPQK